MSNHGTCVHEEIYDDTKTLPDEKEELEILDKDNADKKKRKEREASSNIANKKGYRDLVMSTEGISLNIVENATSEKLSKGDLKKGWGDSRGIGTQRPERIRWKYTPNS